MIAQSNNAMHPFSFDTDKALEVILYVAKRVPMPDLIHICKTLYFADRQHLEEYGRFICGDQYFAMKNGPVPSGVYDLLKANHTAHFTRRGNKIIPVREADLRSLSESDVECLDSAISKYGAMPFNELSQHSHDAAWQAADENDSISLESIAMTLRDGAAILEHLRS